MNTNRRDFLKIVAAGATTALAAPAAARPPRERSPEAVGILYDATLCIGCKACEVACKAENDIPLARDPGLEGHYGIAGAWDTATDLNSRTLTKIKAYREPVPEGAPPGGFSFVKRACMHCVDPNCVSACPVSALTKDPVTGIVGYNPDACIGCRYCQLACPFNVPKFQFEETFPRIVKCELCSDRVTAGGRAACCTACPTGASLFGRVDELLAEGHRRLAFQPGELEVYPVHCLAGGEERVGRVAATYEPRIYGETETGGTQTLLMAAAPFEQLGLPALGTESQARVSETLQHTLYQGLFAPTLLLGGLVYAAYRNSREEGADPEQSDRSEHEERRHD